MSEKEKRIIEKLAAACEYLPESKKEYLIGYAEGVAAMANREKALEDAPRPEEEKGEEVKLA